jgi:hypothetical protein
MNRIAFGLRGWLIVSLCAASLLAADPLPSLGAKDLAQGPFSSMHMLLEKTFLNVDVLTIDVRVAKSAQDRFAELAKGKTYSPELERQLADVVINTDRAIVQLRFVRDVPLEKWMDAAIENIKQARTAGLITSKLQQRVSDSIPKWFAPVKERGFLKGDRVFYEVRPGALRTVVVTADGKVPVDQVSREAEVPRVVLASYFAPESEFRAPLLKSLVK